MIKPNRNSFVWEFSSDPTISLYLDPGVTGAKFENTVVHELHHIGLASVGAGCDQKIGELPQRAHTAAAWMDGFGEGMAMLAAAGGPDKDPHAASSAEERSRWNRDLANFNRDLEAVNAFFLDVLDGKFPNQGAIEEKGSTFFGIQGPWYTVEYKMAVMVEKRFGREALVATMLDPRQQLLLCNEAATEQRAAGGEPLPLWSRELLEQAKAKASRRLNP